MRKTAAIRALTVLVNVALGTAAASAAEKCLKYLPTTGISIEVPCEATEDAQTAALLPAYHREISSVGVSDIARAQRLHGRERN
jgi:hypothetical protein